MKSDRRVSVVLAGYNEEDHINRAMQETYDALDENFKTFELILVDDASKDRTLDEMNRFAQDHPNVVVLPNYVNLNFGTSVLRGMLSAKYDYITFNACDLPVRTLDLMKLLMTMPKNKDVLVMQRTNYLSTKWRSVTSKVNQVLLAFLFPVLTKGTPVLNYTQIYKREALHKIVPFARSPIFVWPELIFRAKLAKLEVINIPVRCNVENLRKGSFGYPHDIIWGVYEMVRFKIRLWKNNY